jgi:hypothetical protein
MSAKPDRPDSPDKKYIIHVDRKKYEVADSPLTGAEIRHLAGLGPEVDLFLEQHGDEEDLPIADGDSVDLQNGMHFFSTPRHITPGRV